MLGLGLGLWRRWRGGASTPSTARRLEDGTVRRLEDGTIRVTES